MISRRVSNGSTSNAINGPWRRSLALLLTGQLIGHAPAESAFAGRVQCPKRGRRWWGPSAVSLLLLLSALRDGRLGARFDGERRGSL